MISGASSVIRITRIMWDGAIPSRRASSSIVTNSPDSSMRFQRKACASALNRVVGPPRLRAALRQLHVVSLAPLYDAERDVERHRLGDRRLAGHLAATNRVAVMSPAQLKKVRKMVAPLKETFETSALLLLQLAVF